MFSKYPLVGYFCFMFEFFRIKTKIELQLQDYILWKNRYSPEIATNHREILCKFLKYIKYKNLVDITLDDLDIYHKHCLNTNNGAYATIQTMEAIRGFFSYYWTSRQHNIKPKQITNKGIIYLQYVEESVNVSVMNTIKRGRPLKIALIEQVKRLRDNEHLSFRAIAKAMGKDVSQVYVWYKFDLQKSLLTNA